MLKPSNYPKNELKTNFILQVDFNFKFSTKQLSLRGIEIEPKFIGDTIAIFDPN